MFFKYYETVLALLFVLGATGLFQAQCAGCHKAVPAPESPSHLAASLWNHAPGTFVGKRRPDQNEEAELFEDLFASGKLGNAARGQRIFASKHCADCHGISAALPGAARAVAQWLAAPNSLALVQQTWNQSREMRAALKRTGGSFPQLSAHDLSDLAAYVQSLPEMQGRPGEFVGAPPGNRDAIFHEKGCAACHRGPLAPGAQKIHYDFDGFAAALWNHPADAPPAPLSYAEMRRLVDYLAEKQFSASSGNPQRGRKTFAKKCGSCHENAASGAPSPAVLASSMNPYEMIAAAWKHTANPPRLTASETADITAFLSSRGMKE